MEFKVRVVQDTVFFWRGGRSGGGRGRRGGGEKTSDSSNEFCLVELEFFGGVEAAGVSEGGGEVVGGFGEVGGEREGGDGDDGVFDCGRGEDSTVEVKKEGWGWGGGEGRACGTFFHFHTNACALGDGGSVGQCICSLVVVLNSVLEVGVFAEGVGRQVSFNCFQEFQVVWKKVVVVRVGA